MYLTSDSANVKKLRLCDFITINFETILQVYASFEK